MPTGCTQDQWHGMTDAVKAKIVDSVKRDNVPVKAETEAQPSPSSGGSTLGWIFLLDACISAFIFVGIIGAIAGGVALMSISTVLGIAVLLLGITFTVLIAAVNKVLIGAAKDLREIRNTLVK